MNIKQLNTYLYEVIKKDTFQNSYIEISDKSPIITDLYKELELFKKTNSKPNFISKFNNMYPKFYIKKLDIISLGEDVKIHYPTEKSRGIAVPNGIYHFKIIIYYEKIN